MIFKAMSWLHSFEVVAVCVKYLNICNHHKPRYFITITRWICRLVSGFVTNLLNHWCDEIPTDDKFCINQNCISKQKMTIVHSSPSFISVPLLLTTSYIASSVSLQYFISYLFILFRWYGVSDLVVPGYVLSVQRCEWNHNYQIPTRTTEVDKYN